MDADNFARLPPTLLVTNGFDPLRDVGHAYARKLAAAGNRITYIHHSDLTHGFIQFTEHSTRWLEATTQLAAMLERRSPRGDRRLDGAHCWRQRVASNSRRITRYGTRARGSAMSEAMEEADRKQISQDFTTAVNMTPARLEKWLDSEESKSVGYADGQNKSDPGGKESVGHASGRRIIDIKRKKKAELTDDDFAHMKKVVGYIHRHMAQKPSSDITSSRWRYSLMNWGHDPVKDD